MINERKSEMTRQDIYREMEDMLGVIPSMFKTIPDSSLELEWELLKRVHIDEGPIPNKYRELMGIAISAVMKCHYCTVHHTEFAKALGATDEEIEDALHVAKSSAGWSTYINGMLLDFEEFKKEEHTMAEHIRDRMAKKAA